MFNFIYAQHTSDNRKQEIKTTKSEFIDTHPMYETTDGILPNGSPQFSLFTFEMTHSIPSLIPNPTFAEHGWIVHTRSRILVSSKI